MATTVECEFLANDQAAIARCLIEALEEFADATFAVAYGTHSAFQLLEAGSAVTRYLAAGRRLRVLFDADRHFTDPELIVEFSTMPGDIECRLFAPRSRHPNTTQRAPAFHAKVYYFETAQRAAAVVGSANFSPGGLRGNSEAAVILRGPRTAPVFESVRGFLERTWNSPYQISVLDSPGFIDAYEKAYAASRRRTADLPIPSEAPVYQSSRDVLELQEAFSAGTGDLANGIIAYVLGLISAGWQTSDLRRRSVSVELRRGLLNRGNRHEGRIFFPGVSERGFDQEDCVRRDVERIFSRIQRAFEVLGTGDRIEIEKRTARAYRIHLQFARDSRVWQAVRNEVRSAGRAVRYLWPAGLDFAHALVRRSFLQGYMR